MEMRVDRGGTPTLTQVMISMKSWVHGTVILAVMLMVGCSSSRQQPVYSEVPAGSGASLSGETEEVNVEVETPELIVTPDESLKGLVVSVNDVGRFAVLRFPLGRMPATGSTLFVYRQGLKVAELEVSGPQQDDHTVADIRSGECQVDDEVRDR